MLRRSRTGFVNPRAGYVNVESRDSGAVTFKYRKIDAWNW